MTKGGSESSVLRWEAPSPEERPSRSRPARASPNGLPCACLVQQQMQHDAPPVGPLAMLEKIHALPCAEPQLPVMDRNAELGLSQRGADVRGHVIRTLGRMAIQRRIFRHQPAEKVG